MNRLGLFVVLSLALAVRGSTGIAAAADQPALPAAETPPAVAPPAEQTPPPAATPPTETPPAVTPPAVTPPTTPPPEATPPATVPPTATPPVATPPAVTPPATSPPEAMPPATVPPTATPPAVAPPAATPPAEVPVPRSKRAAATAGKRLAQPAPLERVLEPECVRRLKLTAEQRAKIAALLAQRDAALVTAAADQRAELNETCETQVVALLTDPQRVEWATIRSEPRLRFQFRFQRWLDVLEWFAGEADLSLVLDAPPPGTFNFSDTREYSPAEAIDLLNGVLLTKGYTLLRRGRMLLVVNLKDGIPEGAVPQLSLDDLDSRGRFELVTVRFPIGRRPVASVISEITPLLGPHGKAVPLAATQQVMVTDTAGIMRSVGAVIESIPEPPAGMGPPVGPAVLATYPLKPADPKVAMQAIAALLPGAKVILDDKADRLLVQATEGEQAMVKKIIEQVQSSRTAEDQPRLTVYALSRTPTVTFAATLQKLAPGAQITADVLGKRLLVIGSTAEQATVKASLDEFEKALPERQEALQTYPVKSADMEGLQSTLAKMYPTAQILVDRRGRRLLVTARADDHAGIEKALAQLDIAVQPGQEEKVMVYTVPRSDVRTVASMLQDMFPSMQISGDLRSATLTAKGGKADQDRLAKAVDDLNEPDPQHKPQVATYPLGATDPLAVRQMLAQLVPNALATVNVKTRTAVVLGTAKDQETVRTALERLAKEGGAGYKAVTYTIESASPALATSVLQQAAPGALLAPGTDPRQIIAWANTEDHKVLAEIVAQMSKPDEGEGASTVKVYTLPSGSAAGLAVAVRLILPDVRCGVGANPNQLIAYARAADHVKIRDIVDKLGQREPDDTSRKVVAYTVRGGGALSAVRLLAIALPEARLSVGADPSQLIAYARPAEQEVIKAAVEQMKIAEPTTKVYRLRQADPTAAQLALTKLAPTAQIALDAVNRSLVVTALPEEQVRIDEAVKAIDGNGGEGPSGRLRIHRLVSADPANVMLVLQGLYRRRLDVQLAVDTKNDAIVAVAAPADQEVIAKLIDQIEKGAPPEAAAQLQLYPLKNVDSTTALRVLNKVFDKEGAKVDLSIEPLSNQLVAIARPAQQETIRNTLGQLRGDDRTLEILNLETVEPSTASLAISRLFSDEGFNAPQVDSDPTTQQLFVRGSKEQLAKIHELLLKMGETGLGAASRGAAMRLVPCNGDAKATIEELQRVWPQLRGNPLKVVTPAAIAPLMEKPQPAAPSEKPGPAPSNPPAQTPAGDVQPAKPATDKATPPEAAKPQAARSQHGDVGVSGTPIVKVPGLPLAWLPPPWSLVCQVAAPTKNQPTGTAGQAGNGTPPTNATPTAPAGTTAPPPASKPAENHAAQPAKPPAVVYIAPTDDKILIASEDADALDQLEGLLRAMGQQTGVAGRNFGVFPIKNTSATRVAGTLQQLFHPPQTSTTRYPRMFLMAASNVVIVPDERTNVLLVQGSRNDRATVESLLKVLDSAEVPAVFAANKPRVVQIQNTDASQIERLLRTVFKAQMASLGGSTSTSSSASSSSSTPGWLAAELTVDSVTNSLIVMAPSPLAESIVDFAQTLDKQAGDDPAREFTFIRLKSASAGRVQDVLDALAGKKTPGTRSSSSSSRGTSRSTPITPARRTY